jgi:2-phosphosulfolactate phosphatase
MPPIEVYLTAQSAPEDRLKGKTVLVIDVLRASSTIIVALDNGARSLIPVGDMAEAGKIAAHMDDDSTVMGGERGGVKIEGYDLGNSPLEYTPDVVQGRTVVLNTTNGTLAIRRAHRAASLAIGGFLNFSESVRFIREADTDVAIVCGGSNGQIALEDVLCAGKMLSELWGGREPAGLSDTARIAFCQYKADKNRLTQAIARSSHARHLIDLGFEGDVELCSLIDRHTLLPVFHDNRLVLSDPSAATVPARVPAPAQEE